jgi:hypothetical protein
VLRQGLHKAIMRPLPRLESEPKSGAIFGQLFNSAALKKTEWYFNALSGG